MDYVVEAGLPLRRSSPAPPRSSYLSGCAGGACGSSSTSDCSQSGGSAGAAVSTEAAEADVEKSRHPEPLFEQTYPHPQQQAAVPLCYPENSSVSLHHPNEEEDAHLQHENNSTQLHKYLSLSTCGDSASNLTTLGNITSTTTTAATTATNTSASVTGSSEASTPLSGASSHQQQRIRAIAQRVVLEANQLRHSLDSRSNSSTHRDNNEEEEEEEATSRVVDPAVPDTVSPAAAVVANTHFTSRSTPSSKRPRQTQTQTQTQSNTEAVGRAMHIPDITTFADSSQAHPTTPMTAANASQLPADATGARTTTTARVLDRVDYEGEISRAVESRYTAENTATTATMTVVKVPTMAAGSNSATHAVAPDATPQEPPPKRFATGEDADMEELGYAVLHSSSADGHKASSDVVSQPSPAVEAVGMEENEEAAGQRPASVRRHRLHPATTATANTEEEEEDGVQAESTSNVRPGDRRGSAASRRAAGTNPHSSGKEGRRKTRLTNSSGVGSLLGGGGRYTNDSITASIPYDPTRFNTPPLAQQPQSEDSPFAQSSSSVPLRPEAAVAVAAATAAAGRQASESQPSCATPPEAKAAPPATTVVQQQQQQQQQQEQGYQPPPTAPSVKLTETRYAFLALSFMMRMLCKLHKGEPIPSSDFHSHCIPPMSVTMYVQRLVRYCACSGEALLCSFVLLLKYVFHSGHPITIYNAHRLLITSILLGIKLRDDVYYSNVYYGRIGGISGREMNKLEVLFLSKLDWETQVYEDEYAALLSLLQEIAVDVDPTPEQLAAFAAMYPEKVASYVPDDDDDELEEAAAKLQQGGTASAAAAAAAPSPTIARTNGNAAAAASSAEVQRRKTLRGAYRLHQWHTKVEPWIAQLQQHVFARRTATSQAMSAAWQEEGQRWAQYYQDDEEAAARLQRERSASAWLSPLSVQKRATSAATVLPAHPQGGTNGESWIVEPPYHSAWPPVEASAYHGVGSASNYTSQQHQQQQQTSAQQEETNPRYSNFINFANVVTGGYFGPSGSATSNSAPSVVGGASGNAANRFVSPASMGGPTPSSTTAAGGNGHNYGIGGGVQRVSSAPGVASTNTVRYHTAAAGNTTTSAVSGPLRQSSATFDITNRATTTAAPSPSFGSGGGAEHGCHSESNSRHSRGSLSGASQHTAAAQPPSVSGTTLRAASPASSSVPGSGINVNAQPYYYVSSRVRKQQQQQQLELSATLGEAPTASAAAASPSEANDPCSLSSSFTSPACVNPLTRFSTAYASASSVTPSSGMEAVLAAMKRGTTQQTVQETHDNTHGSSSGATTAATSAGLTFPARPIAKTATGASHEGEQSASMHMPRRSPQSAHPPATHRRSTYASQHSLGKKRSKPDSYKDY